MTNIEQGINDLALAGTIILVAIFLLFASKMLGEVIAFLFFKIKQSRKIKKTYNQKRKYPICPNK